MAKYRKKPVVIEAFKWMVDEVPEWWTAASGKFGIEPMTGAVYIPTLEGTMKAEPGDMIIKEPFPTGGRDIYPCKPDIFEQTYERVE